MSFIVGPNVAWVRKRAASTWVTTFRLTGGGGPGGVNVAVPRPSRNCPPSSPPGKFVVSISTQRLPEVRAWTREAGVV